MHIPYGNPGLEFVQMCLGFAVMVVLGLLVVVLAYTDPPRPWVRRLDKERKKRK